MKEIASIIKGSILTIEKTTELFYQQKIDEGYKELNHTLIMLTDTMNHIFTYKAEGYDIGVEEDHLVQVLTEAMNALEMKDVILLSDIMQYDLKELLEKVLFTISNE